MSNENGTAIQIRVSGQLFERLEDWRRQQPELPARAAAVRTILEKVLGRTERNIKQQRHA